MRDPYRCFYILAVLAFSAASAHAAGPEAGFVSAFSPVAAQKDFKIHRSKTPDIPVLIRTTVLPGDLITVPPQGSITLMLVDGKEHQYSEPRVNVPLVKPVAWFEHLLRVVRYDDDDSDDTVGSGDTLATRSTGCKTVDVPSLGPGSKVTAGVHTLEVRWTPGCPPFTLSLESPGGQTVAIRKGVQGNSAKLDPQKLVKGRYLLRVSDKENRKADFAIEVVSSLPASPPDLPTGNSRPELLARALWLADVDSTHWRLESVELLDPLRRRSDPLAEALARRLLRTDGPVGTTAP